MRYLDQVKQRLQAKGASEDVQAYVQDLLVQVGAGKAMRMVAGTIPSQSRGRSGGLRRASYVLAGAVVGLFLISSSAWVADW